MSRKFSNKMSHKIVSSLETFIILLSLLLLSFFSLTSCHKGEFSISQVIAQPYVVRENNQEVRTQELKTNEVSWNMGLSLYVHATVSSPLDMQMVVTDPTSSLSWTFVPTSCTFDDVEYYGTSNIALPQDIMLPQGTWNLEILYKDGRTLSFSFEVSYSNFENALLIEGPTPFYDSTSNLTVL